MQLTDNTDYIKQAIAQQELKKMQMQQGGQAPTAVPVAQDIAGQAAQMQNISNQQATQNAGASQSGQLANAAGQQTINYAPNMSLASALRKDKKKDEELANREASQWNQRPAMEYYSKGLDPMAIVSDY